MALIAIDQEALPPEPQQPRPRSSRSVHGEAHDRATSLADETEDSGKATVELAAIMAASMPVTPGPSSPPLEKPQDFAPPTRPSSTPFPHPDSRSDHIKYPWMETDEPQAPGVSSIPSGANSISSNDELESLNSTIASLGSLPIEIHECIIDHLFGYRVSTTSLSSQKIHRVTTSISTMLRHSRRRELSQLACINQVYRSLVQERLFRHIKIKASYPELDRATDFFIHHPHLRRAVKHVEIWFPVFQPKFAASLVGAPMALPTITDDGFALTTYTLPTDNSSLEEVFYFIGTTFPDVQVLTLEGGDRRKAPKVKQFRNQKDGIKLSPIGSVKTLVTKGQWNLIRSLDDFIQILSALPSLEEWHGSYSRPKSKSYLTMASILQALPLRLTGLNLCLEADYRREPTCPPFFLKVMAQAHFCTKLATASPTLEHISYTGRVCHNFFELAAKLADPRTTRLKSIELTVRNCCRKSSQLHDSGSGITDMSFISAFEKLVLSAIRSMEKLTALEFLKIRYIDLGAF